MQLQDKPLRAQTQPDVCKTRPRPRRGIPVTTQVYTSNFIPSPSLKSNNNGFQACRTASLDLERLLPRQLQHYILPKRNPSPLYPPLFHLRPPLRQDLPQRRSDHHAYRDSRNCSKLLSRIPKRRQVITIVAWNGRSVDFRISSAHEVRNDAWY
jgi:hypothetical protein